MKEKIGRVAPVRQRSPRTIDDSGAPASSSEMVPEAIPISDFQVHTKQVLAERFVDIIGTIAQKSAEGSIPHTKYLFEISGIKEELQRQSQETGEPTLADLILAEVRKHQSAQVPTAVEKEARDKVEVSGQSDAEPLRAAEQPIRDSGAKA